MSSRLPRLVACFPLLLVPACILDWDESSGSSGDSPEECKVDVCDTCASLSCDQTCKAGESCQLSCTGTSCDMTCETGSTCNLDCSGTSCDLICKAGATCTGGCSGTSCTLDCVEGSTCDLTCTGTSCG